MLLSVLSCYSTLDYRLSSRWSGACFGFLVVTVFCVGCGKEANHPAPRVQTRGTLLPACEVASPPPFPAGSDGAEFRAIVLLTVSVDGSGEDLCYLRLETQGDLEGTAMADRADWRFNPAHAGQKRERLVVYRLRKRESD